MAAATPAVSARSGPASGWGGWAMRVRPRKYRKSARSGRYDRGGGQTMASILKLPDIWRVILSENGADAEAVVSLLSGGPAHPWLEVRAPSEVATGREDGMTITAVLALTDQPALTPAGDTAIQRLARAGVPVVTVVHGSGRPVDAVARAG